MKPILITGAEGFIGSHLADRVLATGHRIRAIVLYNFFGSWGWLETAKRNKSTNLEIFTGDVRDPYSVRQAMAGCEAVLHLAALIGIPYSYHSPEAYVETNIKGTLNILQAARDLGIKKVIHTSTSEVYGTARTVPITEDHSLQGQSPYSATKIGADQLALSFYHSFGLPVTILRPFNTYGPRQSARAVIPTIITQIFKGKREIQLGSTHPTRDLVFVEDTVDGFLKALEAPNIAGEVIHLGTGHEISIGDLANLISELMGVKISIQADTQRVRPAGSEVERLVADPSKAKKLLGWEPKYAGREGLKQGLLKTIEWFRKTKNLKHYQDDHYVV